MQDGNTFGSHFGKYKSTRKHSNQSFNSPYKREVIILILQIKKQLQSPGKLGGHSTEIWSCSPGFKAHIFSSDPLLFLISILRVVEKMFIKVG